MFGLMTVKRHREVVAAIEGVSDLRLELYRGACKQAGASWAEVRELEAELTHWRQHDQLGDPRTGRLIPRANTNDVIDLSKVVASGEVGRG